MARESAPLESAPLPSFDLTPLPKREAASGPPPPPVRRAQVSTVPPRGRAGHRGLPPTPIAAESAASIPAPAPIPHELASERSLPALARFSAFADARRDRLPASLKGKLSGLSGTTLGVLALASGALLLAGVGVGAVALFGGLGAPAEQRVARSGERSLQSASAPATSAAATASSSAAPASEMSKAKDAGDEATILLDQAERLLGERRDAEVLPLVDRLISREPKLKSDARLGRILLKTAASSNARAAAESFATLKGPMGEPGAALVYELSLQDDLTAAIRRRAEYWLSTKEFARVSSLPLYAAVKLRQAKTCEDKHALLAFAGSAGGKYVLDYLRELDKKTVCSPEALDDCFPCMRNDSRLTSTIAKLEANPTAP